MIKQMEQNLIEFLIPASALKIILKIDLVFKTLNINNFINKTAKADLFF